MNQKTAKSLKTHGKLAAAYRGIRYSKNLGRKIKKLYNQTPRKLRPHFSALIDGK